MMKMRAKRMSSRIAASKANEKPKLRKSDPPKTKAMLENGMRQMEIKDTEEEIQVGINANLAPFQAECKDKPRRFARAKRMSSRIAALEANKKPKLRKSDPPKTNAMLEKEMREMEIKDVDEETQEGINAKLVPSREEYKDEPPKTKAMPEKGMRVLEIKDIKEEIQEVINANLAPCQAEYKDKPRRFSLESKVRAKRMSSRIKILKANEKPKPVKLDPPKTKAMREKEMYEKIKKEIDDEVQEIIDAKFAPFLAKYNDEPSSFVQEEAYVYVPENPVKKQSSKQWNAQLKTAFDRRRIQTAINLKNEARILGNVADLPDYLGND